MSVADLVGRTVVSVSVSDDLGELRLSCSDGSAWRMYHDQDCCECVYLEDVCGDWVDIVGSPVLAASEETSYGDSARLSETWTFYHIHTCRGTVTLRWYGSSNGYYSERVEWVRVR